MSGQVAYVIDRDGVIHQGYSFKKLFKKILDGDSQTAELLSNMVGFIIKSPSRSEAAEVVAHGRSRMVDCKVSRCKVFVVGVVAPGGEFFYDSEGNFHKITREAYFDAAQRRVEADGDIARIEQYDLSALGSVEELRAEFLSRMSIALGEEQGDSKELGAFWQKVEDDSFWAAVEEVLEK